MCVERFLIIISKNLIDIGIWQKYLLSLLLANILLEVQNSEKDINDMQIGKKESYLYLQTT